MGLLDPDLLRHMPLFRRLGEEDRLRIAEVSQLRSFVRGDRIFAQGDPADEYLTIVSGRAKVFKSTPAGKEVILEIFGPGDPLGAVAVYEERPFPAAAAAIEETTCLSIPRDVFFSLLEHHPSMVRGLLMAMTWRLVELTSRLAELSGSRVESRLARLFLKLADDNGSPGERGIHIPLHLSRQELADLTGTTIETCIRIMSRWGKEQVVLTEPEGFVLVDRNALDELAGA